MISAEGDRESPAGTAKFSYANGKVTATDPKGKSTTAPYDPFLPLAASLHPQLWRDTLAHVAKTDTSGVQTTVKALLVDSTAELPIKITPLSGKMVVTVKGSPETARRFGVELAGLSTEMDTDEAGNVVAFDVPVQHLRFLADGWDGLFADPLAKYPELSQATFKYRTESGVRMTTRDGVEIACDVVHPDDDLKHPAILIRTPYGRATETVNAGFYASRGYVVVTQDCRGREDSGGVWDPFVNEGDDGYDAVQWVASQSWSDGNVGMIGGSYDGYVQWAAAVKKPPALKCIIPQVSPPDAMRNIPYDNGIFALYLDLWWAKIVAGKHTDFSTLQSSLPHPAALASLPLSKADQAVLGQHLEFYQKWLNRPILDDWKGFDYTFHLDQVTIPVLHISGVWDGDEIGTHINWNTMRALGRKNEWIVYGPWVHAFNTTHSMGDVEYGKDAIIDLDSVYIRWFDTWLKGKSVGLDKVPHVKLFVTGANKWMTYSDWPSPEMRASTLYLSSNSLTEKPGPSSSKSYTYDPAKNTKIPDILLNMDPGKATTKISTKDMDLRSALFLTTAAFKKGTAIAAPISVKLYFKTSARDTDLYASILDVGTDGSMHLVGNTGKLRGSYLQGMNKIAPLTPGKVYEATVTPWDFAHEFPAGHRLALLIQSTGFPVYARNLGTGEPIANATKMMVQHNTFLMGKGHPSSLSYYVLWQK